jgi:hypothetical protein
MKNPRTTQASLDIISPQSQLPLPSRPLQVLRDRGQGDTQKVARQSRGNREATAYARTNEGRE